NADLFGSAIVSATGKTLTISGTVHDVNGVLATLTYKGDADYNGKDTLVVATSDGTLSATSTVDITVNPINDVPVAQPDGFISAEDPQVLLNVLGNDADVEDGRPTFIDTIDGHPFAVGTAFLAQDGHGTIKVNGDYTITYTPAANYNGSASFTYTAKDSVGAVSASAATVTLTVTAVNDAPTANVAIGAVPATEDAPFSFGVPANAFSDV